MLSIEITDIETVFQQNWSWSAGLASAMFALTVIAGSQLHPERKKDIGLWLSGRRTEIGWSRTFTTLFDALFGARHLSLDCMIRSSVASMIAVTLIFALLGNSETLNQRILGEISLGRVLSIAIFVNLLADYLSLLETRWLLSLMQKRTSFLVQIFYLLFDLVVTTTIVWILIFLFLASPFHSGEAESFAEVLGLFSIFSIFFYSTFLTSLWIWGYVCSTWILRLSRRLRLAYWLDVEGKPVRILALCLGLFVFIGTFTFALVGKYDGQGVSPVDRMICSIFKGNVCLDIAELSVDDKERWMLEILACEGGAGTNCNDLGLASFPEQAKPIFEGACAGGNAIACHNAGATRESGNYGLPDFVEISHYYRRGCDLGFAPSCSALGYLFQSGKGVPANARESSHFYALGCDGDDARGCGNLGFLYLEGLGVEPDREKAVQLLQQACDGDNINACDWISANID